MAGRNLLAEPSGGRNLLVDAFNERERGLTVEQIFELRRREGRLPQVDPQTTRAQERIDDREGARAYLDDQLRQRPIEELLEEATAAGRDLITEARGSPDAERQLQRQVGGAFGTDQRPIADASRIESQRDPYRPGTLPEDYMERFEGRPRRQDTFGEVVEKARENIDDTIGRRLGGLVQALPRFRDELVAFSTGGLSRWLEMAGAPEISDIPIIAETDERVRQIGRGIFDRASAELELNAPRGSAGSQLAYEYFNALVDLGVSVGVAAATRSPTLGAAVVGVSVFGDQFGDARRRGASDEQAFLEASLYSAAEFIGERVVVGRILSGAGGPTRVGRVVNGMVSEGVQETITEGLQIAVDLGIANRDMTLNQAVQRMARAGLIGSMAGATVGAFAPTPLADQAEQEPRPTGLIEQAGIEPPPVTPEDETSPVDTSLITEGRRIMREAEASSEADRILIDNGAPPTGSRVTVEYGGRTLEGLVEDAFTREDAELGAQQGVKIRLDDGSTFDESFADLRDAGVVLRTTEPAPISEGATAPAREPEAPPTARGSARDTVRSRIRQAESGGNDAAENPRSSASGRYQFVDETFVRYHRQVYGGNLSNAQRLAQKNDPAVQERLMDALLADNEASLRRSGYEPSAGNLYLSHHFGPGGAVDILSNPGAQASEILPREVIAANPHIRNMTGAEIAEWAAGRMGQAPGSSTIETAEAEVPPPIEPDYSWMEPERVAAQAGTEPVATEAETAALDTAQAEVAQEIAREPEAVPVQSEANIETERTRVVIRDASEAAISAIRAALPANVRPLSRADGSLTVPVRYESTVREAVAAIQPAELPAASPELTVEQAASPEIVASTPPEISAEGVEPTAARDLEVRDSGSSFEAPSVEPASQPSRFSVIEPVERLTGQEFGADTSLPEVERLRDFRTRAQNWYKDNLVGQTVTTADGRAVRFNNTGLRKSTAMKGETLLKAVPAIRSIIEKGRLEYSTPGDRLNIKAVHFYTAPVEIGGEVHRLGVHVRELQNGTFQYNLTFDKGVARSRPAVEGDDAKASFTPALESTPGGLNIVDLGLERNERSRSDPERVERIKRDLTARMEKLGLNKKAALDFVEKLFDDPNIAGKARGRVITIALRSVQDPAVTLDHEIVHVLRNLGLFKPAEWTALRKAALADTKLMEDVRRRYAKLDAEAQTEEAIADMFAGWAANQRQERGFVATAFRRIQEFFRTLGEALRGNFTTAESVMRAIEKGAVGAREELASVETEKFSVAGGILAGSAEPDYALAEVAVADSRALVSAGLKAKAGAAFDRWRTAAQDRMLPLLRTQRSIEEALGRPLADHENPYMAEELMSGKVGAQLETMASEHVEPLFEAMKEEKVSVEELESFLYARHAPERNAQIAKINPQFSQGEGSGMSDIEAAAILNRIDQAGKREALERVADYVDRMRDFAVQVRVESGLLSEKQAAEWRAIYPNYVPLRGLAELGEEARARTGQGVTVRGPESKRAFGRRSKAEDIIAYTIMQAEEATVRGHKNMVAQNFYRMAESAPNPDFWTLTKVTSKRKLNEETGLVEDVAVNKLTAEDADWTVSLKIDGKERRVTLNRRNPEAARVAEAMRRLDEPQIAWITALGSRVNRFLSAVNTSFNPEFVITNAFRDAQTAMANLSEFEMKGLRRGVARDYLKALVAAEKGSFGKGEGEWADWWREFTGEGGRVFYNQIQDVKTLSEDIHRRFRRIQVQNRERARTAGDMALSAKMGLKAAGELIEKVNQGVENAIRLAAYKNARELGLSKPKAASLAKNLTVNFNRRGSRGVAMNAMYLFYNASVQGSFRILTAMKSPKVRRIAYGMVATGAAMEMLNVLASGVDDDGELFYDKVSDFDKSRNLIIMLPGSSQFVKIPLPYGFNAFYATGRAAVEGLRGRRSRASVFGGLLQTYVDAFNPVGGSNSVLNFIAPTLADPAVDLVTNRDFADRPIMPDQSQYGPPTPDNQRFWGSVNPIWRGVTDTLNRMSGGDEVVPGAVDVSPETLEYMFGVVTGAAGAFVDRTTGAVMKLVDGDPETVITRNDIPMVRKVIGEPPEAYDRAAFYQRLDRVEQVVGETRDYLERGQTEQAREHALENADVLRLRGGANSARRQMQEIRQTRAALETAHDRGRVDDERYATARARLAEREERIMRSWNTIYLRYVEGVGASSASPGDGLRRAEQ